MLFCKDLQQFDEALSIRRTIYSKQNSINTIKMVRLQDANGNERNLLDSPVSINMIILWASWCGPCIKEITDLSKIYEKYKNIHHFRMTSVSLDSQKEDWERALMQHPMPWRQLRLPNSI